MYHNLLTNVSQHFFPVTWISVQFSSVAWLCLTLQPHGLQHTRLPCLSPTPRACSNSCPLSWWCHPTTSSSVVPFFSHLQSSPATESFQNESALHIRWSKYWSFSFNISPAKEHSELIFRMGWLELLSVQGLSRVFTNTRVQKHQFFSAQFSL